ncbi:MAG TPA: radical SAM protein [Candidatus Limnocylindrales bacterium]|nr:radical SAM protein [Candidatus Limnocylindrales bacterium]
MAKIAFINDDSFFRCGVSSIIAVLKKHGHDCEIFLEKYEGEGHLLESVKKYSPDILAFSCTSGEHNWVIKTAKNLKEILNVPILVGGPHPTFFPEIIEEPIIDIVCIGEGEYATLDLLNGLEKGQDITTIENLIVKDKNGIHKNPVRNLIEDLDSLPFMDRDCYNKYQTIKEDTTLHVLTDRGCPYNCSYCYNAQTKEIYKGKGRYVRQRSANNAIEEIKSLVLMYPNANAVRLYDDNIIINKKRLYDFLDLYKKGIKIPFICNATANLLTEEVVKKLKEGGCTRVAVGLESGNENMRNFLLNKKITNEQLLEAAKYCHKYNLRLSTLNMIGLPGETVDNAIETIKLNNKMNPETAIIGIFQPYPGTALAEYARKNGIIDKDYNVKSMTPYFYYTSVLKQKNIQELGNLQLFFWFLVRYPIFISLARLIIKFPPTRFHYFFFSLPILQRKIKYGNNSFFTNSRLILRRIWKVFVFGDSGIEEIGI